MSAQDRKIVIVGAGSVGASTAYTLVNSGLVDELVLVDINRERAEGEVSDLNHGQVFVPPVKIRSGGYDECRDAAIIIVTAGAAQKPGETRLDLTRRNAGIIKGIVEEMNRYLGDQVIIMVTNPVDILTMVAHRVCSLPPHHIIGSGTALDSARFSFFLARHCGVDTRDVRAYVIGEHGDSEVPLWSRVNIAGISFDDYCHICNRDGS
ncbi:MAG TPA: L-lactate dehydrogenase, partial [bacterium]|nr:L-lactate dehydrogenase [bacterium]